MTKERDLLKKGEPHSYIEALRKQVQTLLEERDQAIFDRKAAEADFNGVCHARDMARIEAGAWQKQRNEAADKLRALQQSLEDIGKQRDEALREATHLRILEVEQRKYIACATCGSTYHVRCGPRPEPPAPAKPPRDLRRATLRVVEVGTDGDGNGEMFVKLVIPGGSIRLGMEDEDGVRAMASRLYTEVEITIEVPEFTRPSRP